jgi:hypothetical protein
MWVKVYHKRDDVDTMLRWCKDYISPCGVRWYASRSESFFCFREEQDIIKFKKKFEL